MKFTTKIYIALFSLISIAFILINFVLAERIHKPIAYFTLWNEKALNNYTLVRSIANELKKEENGGFIPKGILSTTYTKFRKQDLNIVIWPRFQIPSVENKEQSYIWLLESPISIDLPITEKYTGFFKKIFTWHKPSVDNKQIFYLPIPYPYNRIIRNDTLENKEYLISQIATYHKGHNYTLREKMVIWLLENHPEDFRFFGKNWPEVLNKLSKNAQTHFFKQYGDFIEDKLFEVSKSKFSLAFENARHDDYVSEKIYDVMVAGTVPIYSGAPNIKEYVPEACYIDFHAFKDYEELYNFISTMSDEKYLSYLSCIKDFLKEPEKLENHYLNVQKTF